MFELKIKNLVKSEEFGWKFKLQAEAEVFLTQLKAGKDCPYAVPSPEWEVVILDTSVAEAEAKAKEDKKLQDILDLKTQVAALSVSSKQDDINAAVIAFLKSQYL